MLECTDARRLLRREHASCCVMRGLALIAYSAALTRFIGIAGFTSSADNVEVQTCHFFYPCIYEIPSS
ncbi:hypothetical protein ECG_03688 [Echinococcus granulosus]|uniref:Secreted protein n=1 Tax=Echinococcus granulosus TaxID=6210 RepID=A0A068WYV4_ECHGR|nr:hypothetical protein ECG_03688 [Echinococcus granulosus]CDS25070.1 hypothetical protein EgrG_002057400 [Echinococcus granulosus]